MQFKDTMTAHLAFLTRRLEQTQQTLKKLPTGKMVTKISRGKFYYYEKRNGKLKNLKDNPEKIQAYETKKTLSKDIPILISNIQFLEKLLHNYIPVSLSSDSWNETQPCQNDYKKEELKHAYNGIYYRSKSEAMIAAMLTSYDIEFKYEVKLNLHGFNIYPDFYIKRPKDGKIYIWEHFGLIADETYLNKTFNKLNNYHRNGYDLWDNLIVSFDQEDGSLNIDTIDKIIHLFLL